MRLLRDLGRRKIRSSLTITGIAIGIMALVVFGSMANKIDALVKGGSDYYKDKVTVSAKGGYMGLGGVLSTRMVGQISPLKGVDVVVPSVAMLLERRGQRRLDGHALDDHRLRRQRRPGTREVRDALRDGSRAPALGRRQQRRRPGLRPGAPEESQSW